MQRWPYGILLYVWEVALELVSCIQVQVQWLRDRKS